MLEVLTNIWEWFSVGIYDFFAEATAHFIEWLMIAKIQFLIFMVEFSWHVAENILANIGISDRLNQAWSQIDSNLLSHMTFFRLPECLNIIIQAGVTKFTLNTLKVFS